MSIVQSTNGLLAVSNNGQRFTPAPAINLNGNLETYGYLYASQPAVRTVVDFLARSVSRVPLHAYERNGETDRTRLTTGPIYKTVSQPWPGVTRSVFFADLMRDLCLYDQYVGIKVRGEDGAVGVVRVPQEHIELKANNFLDPEAIIVRGLNGQQEFALADVIWIRGYNPLYGQSHQGLSPMETLRRQLAELDSAANYREGFWRNAARISGVIERPPGAPKWSPEARARFRNDWQSAYAGDAGSGKTAVLEDGMAWKPASFSASDSQYIESINLTRSAVASAFGVAPELVGIGSANYAQMDTSHRMLIAETLTPHLIRIQEELARQLLPELTNDPRIELEFSVEALTRGSFEEQVSIYQAAVGAPWLTRNEARTRVGLSRLPDGDQLVTPLNVLTGGMASPQDSVPLDRQLQALAAPITNAKSASTPASRQAQLRKFVQLRAKQQAEVADTITALLERQANTVLSKLGAAKSADGMKADSVYDKARWTREAKKDLKKPLTSTAQLFGSSVADQFDAGFNAEEGMASYLDAVSSNASLLITDRVSGGLRDALDAEDPSGAVSDLFDGLATGFAAAYAFDLAGSVGSTAVHDAAFSNGAATKTWNVTSANPRPSHAQLDGMTIGLDELFPNGLRWPCDSVYGDAEERANCECFLTFNYPDQAE
jgi:HK97 family phage portal protein